MNLYPEGMVHIENPLYEKDLGETKGITARERFLLCGFEDYMEEDRPLSQDRGGTTFYLVGYIPESSQYVYHGFVILPVKVGAVAS